MKKTSRNSISLLLAGLMLLCLSLCACGGTSGDTTGSTDDTVAVQGVEKPENTTASSADISETPTVQEETESETAYDVPYRSTFAAGDDCSVALGQDGEVYTAVESEPTLILRGSDLVSVDLYTYCLGLKNDGTVICKNICGNIRDGLWEMDDVSSWSDIVAVAAGYSHNVGLKRDGTVVYAGHVPEAAAEALPTWESIVAIDAGQLITVGLKEDGTVVACGGEVPDVSSWSGITAVSAAGSYVMGLKADGTVVAASTKTNDPRCDVSSWTDIVAICAGLNHCVGLKADGTVVSTVIVDQDYDLGQCNVGDWTDIVAISANHTHTLGLKSDGTVVAVGADYCSGCKVGDWGKIQLP